jgi:hypothetical protein
VRRGVPYGRVWDPRSLHTAEAHVWSHRGMQRPVAAAVPRRIPPPAFVLTNLELWLQFVKLAADGSEGAQRVARGGVVLAEAGLKDRQSTFMQGTGSFQVALGVQDVAQVGEAGGGQGMVGTKTRLADRQRTSDQGTGTVQVALIMQDGGRIVEDDRCPGAARGAARRSPLTRRPASWRVASDGKRVRSSCA